MMHAGDAVHILLRACGSHDQEKAREVEETKLNKLKYVEKKLNSLWPKMK